MKTRRSQRLFRKLIYFVFPLLIFSLIITAGTLIWTNHGHFVKTIEQDYGNVVASTAGQIQYFMENSKKDMEQLARVLSVAGPDEWQQEITLKAFNLDAMSTRFLCLLPVAGGEIIFSGRKADDRDPREDETYRKALGGKTATSGVLLTHNGMPYVLMAAPVFQLGEVKAVLWSQLTVKATWEVIRKIDIGETGTVSVRDMEGNLILDRDVVRVFNNRTHSLPPEVLEELTAAHHGHPVAWWEERSGIRHRCIGALVPSLGWIVAISQSDDEMYAYLYRNIRWTALAAFIVCLCALLVAWRFARRFLEPVEKLHHMARLVSGGDLEHTVSIQSGDEIAELGEAFNGMVESLKAHIAWKIQTERELLHARNLAILGTASSKMAHEVGNLLSNIEVCIHALRKEAMNRKSVDTVQLLEKESYRIRDFVGNFLQFARKPELRLVKTHLELVVEEVLTIHEAEARERGIELKVISHPGVPAMPLDASKMYLVVKNLVKNSLEAMEGRPGTVTVEIGQEDGSVFLAVRDTGAGIEPGSLDSIFVPFFSTKGLRGTGLGLCICKTYVEAHRGTMTCTSTPGEGTTFLLQIPCDMLGQ